MFEHDFPTKLREVLVNCKYINGSEEGVFKISQTQKEVNSFKNFMFRHLIRGLVRTKNFNNFCYNPYFSQVILAFIFSPWEDKGSILMWGVILVRDKTYPVCLYVVI